MTVISFADDYDAPAVPQANQRRQALLEGKAGHLTDARCGAAGLPRLVEERQDLQARTLSIEVVHIEGAIGLAGVM